MNFKQLKTKINKMDYETEISMLDIKTMFLNHQLLRLQMELKKDILNENLISFLRKDIFKLQEYINENKLIQ